MGLDETTRLHTGTGPINNNIRLCYWKCTAIAYH